MPPTVPNHLALLVAAVDYNSKTYDLVLLAHVLAAVVGMVAVVVSGGFALTLRGALAADGPLPVAVVRYYRPGINWVGRVLFLVPVLGAALIAMSGGQWGYSDAWVAIGLAVWTVVAMAAEGMLWPAERRLQRLVAAREAAVAVGAGAPAGGAAVDEDGSDPVALCLWAGLLGIGLGATLVAVAVLMVAKP